MKSLENKTSITISKDEANEFMKTGKLKFDDNGTEKTLIFDGCESKAAYLDNFLYTRVIAKVEGTDEYFEADEVALKDPEDYDSDYFNKDFDITFGRVKHIGDAGRRMNYNEETKEGNICDYSLFEELEDC